MDYQIVFRSLSELFPLIDVRMLKAVAIEHPKDADQAAAIVISEIVPKFYPNLTDNNKKTSHVLTGGSETDASSTSGTTIPLAVDSDYETMPNDAVESGVVSSDSPAFLETETIVTSNESDIIVNHIESSVTVVSEDESLDDVKEEVSSGSLVSENSDVELNGSDLVDETSMVEPELSRSNHQGCNIDHLEAIIEDAKSNKKTLFTVMESIMNLMREVELEEKEAEKMKEDVASGGLDTLEKVEELKKMLKHAKEANDIDAGEVYGERSILTTEATELENRLLNLSDERDKSLSVLDEMRETLETRLAAALEIKNAAEKEKQEKEGCACKEFAEQEAIMEKVVQQSKLLQQEAEENSKLREFLMDRGRIVDSLQGEISVICQDIRHLKEKFDNRVPLSQSISSSQTSCKLASSSGSSMKNLLLLEKPSEVSNETPEASGNNSDKSPKDLVDDGNDERKELLEEGWDIFDKETEL